MFYSYFLTYLSSYYDTIGNGIRMSCISSNGKYMYCYSYYILGLISHIFMISTYIAYRISYKST